MDTPAGLTFRARYWDDREARESFKRFLLDIHELDLTAWERAGYWNDDYVPFSLFDGDRVAASVCLYSMDMVLDGRRTRVGQFCSVGTRPERRREGLGRWLTEQAVAWAAADHDGFFLFADRDAVPFYRTCGFDEVEEAAPRVAVNPPGLKAGIRRLDPADRRDRARLFDLAGRRAPVSDIVGVRNPELTLFHFLYGMRDHGYHIPDLDVIVFCKVDAGRLIVFDIIGRDMPLWSEVHPYLAAWPHGEVEFRFVPDRMGVTPSGSRSLADNHAFVSPGFTLPEPDWQFPHTAHA